METAPTLDRSPLARMEQAVDAETTAAATLLVRTLRLSQEDTTATLDRIRREAWTDFLSSAAPGTPEAVARRAGLRAVARALRDHGIVQNMGSGETPLPEGLTLEALRGALMEVIPGRRSVVGLYLRGYTPEELAILYGLEAVDMGARLEGALQSFRSSLHRRAERLNVPSWSQALESQPIESVRGMLRQGDVPASRLRCTDPMDQAEAVNGTHFRGGREGALDHAVTCDPCAAEIRTLFALHRAHRPGDGPALDAEDLEQVRREARSRPQLRPYVTAPVARRGHRRTWPWIVLAAAGALLAWVLL